jgi:hypothetical protein
MALLVETQLGVRAEIPSLMRKIFDIYGAIGGRIGSDAGSWTSVFVAASPEMKEQSGTYFQRVAEAGWQSGKAKNMVFATKLEDWTREEMGKKAGLNELERDREELC